MTPGARRRIGPFMAKPDPDKPKPIQPSKEDRLAAALRANLRRRKAPPEGDPKD